MKLIATRKHQQNHAVIDPWTVVHLSFGLAFGLMRIPLRWVLPAAVAYEVVEQVVERQEWGQQLFDTQVPETVPNAIADTLVFVAGHAMGRMWNENGRDA